MLALLVVTNVTARFCHFSIFPSRNVEQRIERIFQLSKKNVSNQEFPLPVFYSFLLHGHRVLFHQATSISINFDVY